MSVRAAEPGVIVEEGLREARAVSHPVMRARHLHAWALRLSASEPERAAELLPAPGEDPVDRAQVLTTVLSDRLRRGDADLEPEFSRALELLPTVPSGCRPHLANSLSETAIELADRSPEAGAAHLSRMAPVIRALPEGDPQERQSKALALALLGEALLMLRPELGLELLREAQALSEDLPGREALAVFLATALAEREPERAAELCRSVQQLETRLELRLQLIEKLREADLRREIVNEALEEATRLDQMQHVPLSQALVRLARALQASDPEQARELFRRARETEPSAAFGQARALQVAGVATAVAPIDREWAGELFGEAVSAARAEEDPLKRITTSILIANEMAESFPREAAEVFAGAAAEATGFEAIWEYAHLLDIIFHAERSPYLDVRPALPIVEAALARISDEDPRVPGVFGLPELAQYLAQVDVRRAVAVLWRWYRSSEEVSDSEGMLRAALMIRQIDPAAGAEALETVRDAFLRRVDCMALGEFCRAVSGAAPLLAAEVAPQIPDPRERKEALTAAAAGLYGSNPERALEIVRELPLPADRSTALLSIADSLLGTGDRYRPQPLLEDMP